jgi:serine/threonine-protein kinase
MAELSLAIEDSPLAGGRFVIVKRIRPERANDADYIEFFLTEGRIALRCAHPSLPHSYELGVIDGVHYLAMEYIHGHTLLDVVNAATRHGSWLSVGAVHRVGVDVAAGLEHLHSLRDTDGTSLGVVHRDVSPQNVMLHHAGAIKLIDFGIVRSSLQTHKTRTGVVKGKFSYLAPEAFERGRTVDQRADLFGLGIVLHEALTGRSLFRGRDDSETMRRLKSGEIPDPREARDDLPDALAEVIVTALRRDPETRFQTATEFLAALERAGEQAGITTSITGLRQEVSSLCGEPEWPRVGAAPDARDRRLGSGGDPALAKLASSDDRLAYFLERSASGPDSAPGEASDEAAPGSSDAALDELMSRLDR